MNITTVSFGTGDTIAIAEENLYQYDYGQILQIEGIELPTVYTVDFCNAGDSDTIPMVGDANGVTIPDDFLRTGKNINAFIWLHAGDADGETEYKIIIPVAPRPERGDEEPTPTQQTVIDQLITELNNGVAHVDEVAENLNESPFAPGTGQYSAAQISTETPNNVTGINAFGAGADNEVSGRGAATLGTMNIASGQNSIALGGKISGKPKNQATMRGAVAIGASNQANGYYSVAIGAKNTASNNYSMVFGNESEANAIGSVALSTRNTASGYSSTVTGYKNEATGAASLVFGMFAEPDSNPVDESRTRTDNLGEVTPIGARKYAFILGNGASEEERSNAATIDWGGNAEIAGKMTVGAAPTADMDVATKKYVDDAVARIENMLNSITIENGVLTFKRGVNE